MLILPPGHAQQIAARPRFSRRERWMVASVALLAVALAAVLVASLASGGRSSSNGCVEVNLPYSTGGQELYRCGRQAREMCAGLGHSTTFTGAAVHAVATQCRKAGLPAGSPG